MEKKTTLSPEQDCAANPTENVWVQANAGPGKTSVLTGRLLRILFRTHDVLKTGVLCLTYTNAGAGEMRNRILKKLKQWASASDDDMRELLDGVTQNRVVSDADIAHAREIFFTYIDNPNMLKVKTIHGFCEEILHRFPIEAGISPAWKLVSDADGRALLWDVFNNMLRADENAATQNAFSRIVERVSEYAIDDLLRMLEHGYQDFFMVTNHTKYREYFTETIADFLKIKNAPNCKIDASRLQGLLDLARASQSVRGPKKYLQTIADLTQKYIDNKIDFDEYKTAYLTKTGGKIVVVSNIPDFVAEQSRVFAINEYNENKKIYDDTIALFDLSAAFARGYMETKRARNILDFSDLILYTRKLFSDPKTMGWVLSQMDVTLSHILVDEAQDTSPAQWDIIRMLTGDFFDDGDTSDLPRSLFVVGDTKQSIYGFQGADPVAFIRSRDDIARQIENNYRTIRDIPLAQNFRSLPSILHAVDTFFDDETVKRTSAFVNQPHICFRATHDKNPGLVYLHRLVARGETDATTTDYVKQIAQKIQSVLALGKYMPADIMVLVQNRHPFMAPLVLELKKMGIPVAGSDRIVLPTFAAIRDLLNLTRFCLDTTDDYSLCCVLKSPLFRFSETDIYNLCREKNQKNAADNGTTTTVYAVLSEYNPSAFARLSEIVAASSKMSPYSFFTYVLSRDDNREKMIAALGEQIIDPLEEFMTICLSYERTQTGTLREFLKWFITGGAEIKRDMDAAMGVRIVTVHGSKGLESPVVFLIDTVRTPDAENIVPLPVDVAPEYPAPWIWCASGTIKTEPVQVATCARRDLQIAEYFRLLYVAMTRARDELYIYGFTPYKNANELSWYANLWRVFSKIYATSDTSEYIEVHA